MINLTRINHVPLVLNSDLIEHIETTPDTVISLTNGQKLVVLESPEEVVQKVVNFRRTIHACGCAPRGEEWRTKARREAARRLRSPNLHRVSISLPSADCYSRSREFSAV